jgi:PhnB protein
MWVDACASQAGRSLLLRVTGGSRFDPFATAEATRTQPVGEEHGWWLGRFKDPVGHEWEIGRPLVEWPPAPA